MKKQIEHKGVVMAVTDVDVTVCVKQHSACSMCEVASLCRSSDSVEKIFLLPLPKDMDLKEGDLVLLIGNVGLGLRAVLHAYIIPLVL